VIPVTNISSILKAKTSSSSSNSSKKASSGGVSEAQKIAMAEALKADKKKKRDKTKFNETSY